MLQPRPSPPWPCSGATKLRWWAPSRRTNQPGAAVRDHRATQRPIDLPAHHQRAGLAQPVDDRLDESSAQVPDQGSHHRARRVCGQHLPGEIEDRSARRMTVRVIVSWGCHHGEKTVEQKLGGAERRDHPPQRGMATHDQDRGAEDQAADSEQPRQRGQRAACPAVGSDGRRHDLAGGQRRPQHRTRCRTDAQPAHPGIIPHWASRATARPRPDPLAPSVVLAAIALAMAVMALVVTTLPGRTPFLQPLEEDGGPGMGFRPLAGRARRNR